MRGRTAQLLYPNSPEGRARRWLPFWVVQALEIAVAVVFVDVSIHVGNSGLLVAGAIALLTLAVTARGPLGIVRVCSQPLHLVAAMVVSVLLALAPTLAVLRPDIQGIIVIEFGAVGLLRVCTLTRADGVPTGLRSATSSRPGPSVIDATAKVGGARTGPPPTAPPPSNRAGAASSDAAARWAGRTTGAAAATGKKVAAAYGPKAGERIRRSIRSAGRIAGSITAPPKPPGGDRD